MLADNEGFYRLGQFFELFVGGAARNAPYGRPLLVVLVTRGESYDVIQPAFLSCPYSAAITTRSSVSRVPLSFTIFRALPHIGNAAVPLPLLRLDASPGVFNSSINKVVPYLAVVLVPLIVCAEAIAFLPYRHQYSFSLQLSFFFALAAAVYVVFLSYTWLAASVGAS